MSALVDEPNHPTRPCSAPHLRDPVVWCPVCGWPETHTRPAAVPVGILDTEPDDDPGCGCPYDEHDPWCPARPPVTERDGIRVGDEILLHPHFGGPWPARVIEFLPTIKCCLVVEWTGLQPLTGGPRSTVCREQMARVEVVARA